MHLLSFTLILLIYNFFATSAHASNSNLANLVNNFAKKENISGSILIKKGTLVILRRSFKYSDYKNKTQNTSSTLFPIASVTKQFTAATVLKFIQQGKLDLKTPIRQYIPELPESWGKQISIHHLLSHSSGLSNYIEAPDFSTFYLTPHSSLELLAALLRLHLEFNPGDHYEYSGSGFNLLGILLERVSGKRFGDLIHDTIFQPADMKNSVCPHSQLLSNFRKTTPVAEGYLRSKNKIQWEFADDINLSTAFSEASCISNVEDLDKWNSALFTNKILEPQYLQLMTEPKFPTHRNRTKIGYGIFLQPGPNGDVRYFHNGMINGFRSSINYFPRSALSIVVLSNTMNWDPDTLIELILKKGTNNMEAGT